MTVFEAASLSSLLVGKRGSLRTASENESDRLIPEVHSDWTRVGLIHVFGEQPQDPGRTVLRLLYAQSLLSLDPWMYLRLTGLDLRAGAAL